MPIILELWTRDKEDPWHSLVGYLYMLTPMYANWWAPGSIRTPVQNINEIECQFLAFICPHSCTHVHRHTHKNWNQDRHLRNDMSNCSTTWTCTHTNTHTHTQLLNKPVCVLFQNQIAPYKNYTQIPAVYEHFTSTRTVLGDQTFAHLTLLSKTCYWLNLMCSCWIHKMDSNRPELFSASSKDMCDSVAKLQEKTISPPPHIMVCLPRQNN